MQKIGEVPRLSGIHQLGQESDHIHFFLQEKSTQGSNSGENSWTYQQTHLSPLNPASDIFLPPPSFPYLDSELNELVGLSTSLLDGSLNPSLYSRLNLLLQHPSIVHLLSHFYASSSDQCFPLSFALALALTSKFKLRSARTAILTLPPDLKDLQEPCERGERPRVEEILERKEELISQNDGLQPIFTKDCLEVAMELFLKCASEFQGSEIVVNSVIKAASHIYEHFRSHFPDEIQRILSKVRKRLISRLEKGNPRQHEICCKFIIECLETCSQYPTDGEKMTVSDQIITNAYSTSTCTDMEQCDSDRITVLELTELIKMFLETALGQPIKLTIQCITAILCIYTRNALLLLEPAKDTKENIPADDADTEIPINFYISFPEELEDYLPGFLVQVDAYLLSTKDEVIGFQAFQHICVASISYDHRQHQTAIYVVLQRILANRLQLEAYSERLLLDSMQIIFQYYSNQSLHRYFNKSITATIETYFQRIVLELPIEATQTTKNPFYRIWTILQLLSECRKRNQIQTERSLLETALISLKESKVIIDTLSSLSEQIDQIEDSLMSFTDLLVQNSTQFLDSLETHFQGMKSELPFMIAVLRALYGCLSCDHLDRRSANLFLRIKDRVREILEVENQPIYGIIYLLSISTQLELVMPRDIFPLQGPIPNPLFKPEEINFIEYLGKLLNNLQILFSRQTSDYLLGFLLDIFDSISQSFEDLTDEIGNDSAALLTMGIDCHNSEVRTFLTSQFSEMLNPFLHKFYRLSLSMENSEKLARIFAGTWSEANAHQIGDQIRRNNLAILKVDILSSSYSPTDQEILGEVWIHQRKKESLIAQWAGYFSKVASPTLFQLLCQLFIAILPLNHSIYLPCNQFLTLSLRIATAYATLQLGSKPHVSLGLILDQHLRPALISSLSALILSEDAPYLEKHLLKTLADLYAAWTELSWPTQLLPYPQGLAPSTYKLKISTVFIRNLHRASDKDLLLLLPKAQEIFLNSNLAKKYLRWNWRPKRNSSGKSALKSIEITEIFGDWVDEVIDRQLCSSQGNQLGREMKDAVESIQKIIRYFRRTRKQNVQRADTAIGIAARFLKIVPNLNIL